jgi:hypothetical protein
VSSLETFPANLGLMCFSISRMVRARPLLESLRLVARLHVDLQRLSSAICQF